MDAGICLQDFDSIVEATWAGFIRSRADIGDLKTSVALRWLQRRGFGSRLVERRFDRHFRHEDDEPTLAICGFDRAGPRIY
jgi:hypothetical protein